MYFRTVIYLVIFLLGVVGCSEFLNGKANEPEVIELTDAKYSCLKELPNTVQSMTNGKASRQEVDSSFSCLQSALIYFKDRTKGTFGEAYTAEDFRKFFGKYFLKENNISSALSIELVKFKAALIGGQATVVTKEEVVRLSSVIGILKEELMDSLPYIKLFLLKEPSAGESEIQKGISSLRISVHRILKQTSIAKSEYSFEDTQRLVQEILQFVKKNGQSEDLKRVEKYWPFFQSLKMVLLGEHASFVGLKDWEAALDSFVDLYDLGLRTHYLTGDFNFSGAADTSVIGDILDRGVSLLENSHQMKQRGFILTDAVDQVIDMVYDHHLAKLPITKDTLKDTYKTVFGRLLMGSEFRLAAEISILDLRSFNILKGEIRLWRAIQNWVNGLAGDSSVELKWDSVLSNMKSYDFLGLTLRLMPRVNKAEISFYFAGWSDFSDLVNRKIPLSFNHDGRFVLDYNPKVKPTSWGSLSRSNLMHSLTRLMIRGYSEKFYEFPQGRIGEDQIVRWYDDFKSLGLEIKAFDPRNVNAGKRSFKEANFFMPSSDGLPMDFKNRWISWNEMYEMIGLLVSAGLESVSELRKMADSQNCRTEKLDVFDLPLYQEECFKWALRKDFENIFNNLPNLVSYIGAKSSNWNEYYENLMAAARTSEVGGGLVEHADVRTFVMMAHYEESLIMTYDSNRDGVLNLAEIEAAAPRFIGFLKEIKPAPDWLLTEGFIYLVLEGHQPTTAELLADMALRKSGWPPAVHRTANRAQLAKVFRSLKEQLK